jgi:ABC-type glycerol-3-phosphate transport system substrate-binding protein
MTRRGLRFLSVIIFLGMATALFAAGQGEKVALKFFTGKTETVDWMNALIERFQKDNPGITVEQEFQKDASNVIKVKLAAGDYPDITTVYTPQYAEQGLYLDLSGESAWWSRIQPGIKGKCTDVKSGKQYRVATNMTMAGLYYNKKIFADLGLDVEGLHGQPHRRQERGDHPPVHGRQGVLDARPPHRVHGARGDQAEPRGPGVAPRLPEQ